MAEPKALPEEIIAAKPKPLPDDVAGLVDAMPELDGRGAPPPGGKGRRGGATGKLTGPEWKDAQPVYDKILAGGRKNVAAVIAMLKEVDNGDDYKARYTLHGLGAYTGRAGKENQHADVVAAIVAAVTGDAPKPVKLALVRELVLFGDKTATAALAGVLTDAELCSDAARALVAGGTVEPLRTALPAARDAACRAHIVNALGELADAASAAALRRAADDADQSVRICARFALAKIGDASAADMLAKACAAEGWEGIQAADACLVLAEKLAAAGGAGAAEKLRKAVKDAQPLKPAPAPAPQPAAAPTAPKPNQLDEAMKSLAR